MVPMVLASSVANAAAFAKTRDSCWLWAAGFVFAILPYTAIVMLEDISSLRAGAAGQERVKAFVKSFCMKHHARTIAATAGLACALTALSKK